MMQFDSQISGKICHVVGGGDFSPALLRQNYAKGDLLIAADRGAELLLGAGIAPQIVIGDFDSSTGDPTEFPGEVIYLPVEKDDTDLAAAAFLGFERGFRQIFLYGALGGQRFSHSLSAVQLLAALHDKGCKAAVLDENCTLLLLQNGSLSLIGGRLTDGSNDEDGFLDRLPITTQRGSLLSLFVLSDRATVSERGLKYPLDHGKLTNRYPLGVSNEFTDGDAMIEVQDGCSLLVFESF